MRGAGAGAEVVVIGGGVMGLFVAHHLAEVGAGRVVVLEKSYVGAGSSGKSGAILRQHYSHETTVLMSRESLGFYRSYRERTGRDVGFTLRPMIVLCHERDRGALEGNVRLQKRLGVAVEILDARELRDLEPRAVFGDDVIGAVETEAGFVDPGKMLAALARGLRDSRGGGGGGGGGVDLREGVRVTDILLDGNQAVRGVRTDTGETIATRAVVNAGGPWAKILCARLGLDPPLSAIRPQQAYFVPPADHGPERFIFGDVLTGLYWKPEPAGWTRVGHLAYAHYQPVADPDHYDEGVSNEFLEDCRARISQRLPAYRRAVCWGGCGALYTVTPDAHALIGPIGGIEGFLLVSGFSGHGFKMGPAVGRGVAAMIAGGDSGAFDAEFFATDRFERGRPVSSSYEYGILG